MNNVQLACVYLLVKKRRERENAKKIKRRWWIRPFIRNRKNQGAYHNLVAEMRLSDTDSFFNFYRMTPKLYDKLLTLVGPGINKKWIVREPISASERLSLTLRYIMSGDSMTSIMYLYRISTSAISLIIKEVCDELWSKLHPLVLPSPTEINWKQKADEFYKLWNFPNCCGAIDGKHVVLQAPPNSGSIYYNYKGTFSVVLLAICDANYIFTSVDIGAPGRQSDGGTFSKSVMGTALENKNFGLPDNQNIPNTSTRTPFVIVGDEAFPLKSYLMRPYPGKNLSPEKVIFNYRLSRARRTIENAFGIMVARMRILRKPIIADIGRINAIIKAVVVLHNFLQTSDVANAPNSRMYCPARFVDYEDNNGVLYQGLWRQEVNELPAVGQQGSNRYSGDSANIRKEFTNYFMLSGSVPWQWNKLPRV